MLFFLCDNDKFDASHEFVLQYDARFQMHIQGYIPKVVQANFVRGEDIKTSNVYNLKITAICLGSVCWLI